MISNKKLVIVKDVSMKAMESENKECDLQVPRMKFFLLRFLRTTVLEDNSRSAFQKKYIMIISIRLNKSQINFRV